MKKAILVSLILLVTLLFVAPVGSVEAVQRVRGYTKRSGIYVAPHFRQSPNRSKFDNFSTKGNINPYTGKIGTVNPYKITPKRYR